MKTRIINWIHGLSVFMALASSAFARIGETPEQLDARYGRPTKITQTSRFSPHLATETREYLFKGFEVEVVVWKGTSHQEQYRKVDFDQAKVILESNSIGTKYEWEAEPTIVDQRWHLDDVMFAYWQRDDSLLTVYTSEIVEARRLRKVSSASVFLDEPKENQSPAKSADRNQRQPKLARAYLIETNSGVLRLEAGTPVKILEVKSFGPSGLIRVSAGDHEFVVLRNVIEDAP